MRNNEKQFEAKRAEDGKERRGKNKREDEGRSAQKCTEVRRIGNKRRREEGDEE